MSLLTRALLYGLAGWAVATVLFRLLGQYIFPNDVIVLSIMFLAAPIALFFLAGPIFGLIGASPSQFPLTATALVLPGMLLDSFVVSNLKLVLPNVERSLDGTFGGFLLLAYASILAAGIIFRSR